MQAVEEDDVRTVKSQVIDLAVKEGVRAAAVMGTLAGGAVYAAHKYSPWFNKSLGISGKVGTVMIAITGSFFLIAEKALIDAQRHPDAYGFEETEGAAALEEQKELAKAKKLHIRPQHVYATMANYLYDHPFQMLISLSVPVIGGFFWNELKKPGLKLSQMIIHTRVQGQASVITILALTMGFREWMQKNGGRIKFEEDEK